MSIFNPHLKWGSFLVIASIICVTLLGLTGRASAQKGELEVQQRPAENRAPDIVGGNNAQPGEWPWQVTVYPGGGLCGGSLIATNWVLTAAHCVVDPSGNVIGPGQVEVVVGDHDRSVTEGTEQVGGILEVIPHPNYSPSTQDNDIALLKINGAATIVPGQVEIVPLNVEGSIPAGTLATVTGWGATAQGGNTANILQEVQVPIVTNQVCNVPYEGGITGNMICAGFQTGGKDSCQGDSGGPLVIPDGTGGWVQAGVVSFGIGCAQPNFYGVYARVSQYIDWVETVTGTVSEPIEPPDTPSTGTDLLINGNFDQAGDLGWAEFSTNGFTLIGDFSGETDISPLSAPGMAWMGGADNEESEIAQTVTLPSSGSGNDTYTLTYSYQINSGANCETDYGGFLINDEIIDLFDLCSQNNTNSWQTVSHDLSVLAGETVTLQFGVINDTSQVSSFFVDSVSLIYTAATPPDPEPPVPGTGPIPNGDFELGMNGDWLEQSQLGYQFIFSTADGLGVPPNSGNYFAWLGGANNEVAILSQVVTIPADTLYLEFFALAQSDDYCGYDAAGVFIDDIELGSIDLCQENNTSEWLQIALDVSPFAGQTVNLQFGVITDEEFISSLYLDDISFISGEPVPPTEEPSDEPPIYLVAESGTASIELEWTLPDDPEVAFFEIYRQVAGAEEAELLATTEVPFYSDTDPALMVGSEYYYVVYAVRGDNSTAADSNIASAIFGQLTVSIPSVVAPVGSTDLIVPINISNAAGLEVISSTLYIDYNSAHVTPIALETTQLTEGYEAAGTVFEEIEPGVSRMKIEFAADNPAPIYGDGSLIWVMFEVLGSVGDRSGLEFIRAAPGSGGSVLIDQNDGEISLFMRDGQIEIVASDDTGNSFGDINTDGQITQADAQMALDYSAGLISLNSSQISAGDINGDGEVNPADASMILYYVENNSWPTTEEGLDVGVYEISLTELTANALNIGTTLSGVPVGGFEFTSQVDPTVVAALNFTPSFTSILSAVNYQPDGAIRVAMASGTNFGDDLSSLGTIAVTFRTNRDAQAGSNRIRLGEARLYSPSGLDYEDNFPGTNGTLVSTEISSGQTGITIYLPYISR